MNPEWTIVTTPNRTAMTPWTSLHGFPLAEGGSSHLEEGGESLTYSPPPEGGRGTELGTFESLTYSPAVMVLVALVLVVVVVVTAFGNLLVCLALVRYRINSSIYFE